MISARSPAWPLRAEGILDGTFLGDPVTCVSGLPPSDDTQGLRRMEETEGAVDLEAEGCAEGKMEEG